MSFIFVYLISIEIMPPLFAESLSSESEIAAYFSNPIAWRLRIQHLCHMSMTQGLRYSASSADAFGGGRNVWYRLFAASVGEWRIKKKKGLEKETKKKRSYAQDEMTRRERKGKRKRETKEGGRERNDRQKRLSQKQNESETNKIGWTWRESRRGALSWSSRAWEKASRFIDREGLQLAPRSPRALPVSPTSSLLVPANGYYHCFIKIEPTHARAAILTCAPPASLVFPPTRLRVSLSK